MRMILAPTLASATLFCALPLRAQTAHTFLSAADLEQQVSDFLQAQADTYNGQAQIVVEPLRAEQLAPCTQAQAFLSGGARLRSRLSVGIRCLAPQNWVSYTQANLAILGTYYVTSRGLQPGSVINDNDLQAREGDLLRLANGIVHDRELLIGSITTRRIGPGSPIKANALRSADSIERGQNIRLEARGAGFVVNSHGVALEGGEPGTQIKVRTASGQAVSGTVLNAGTVLVLM